MRMVKYHPRLGRSRAQRLSAITWKVDVGRWARLAAATGLRAAILEDVFNGRYTAPCRGEQVRHPPAGVGWATPLAEIPRSPPFIPEGTAAAGALGLLTPPLLSLDPIRPLFSSLTPPVWGFCLIFIIKKHAQV